MRSRIIKKTISSDEKIKKYFSVCNRYIKFQIIASLTKWLFIFLAISIALFFIDQAQIFTIPRAQKVISEQSENFSEDFANYGLEKSKLNFLSFNTGQTSQGIFNLWIILALIFLLIVVPFIIFFNMFYIRISNEFVITDQRIIVKKGWISTNVKTIHYNRITDISITQSLLDRILKTGTLLINTAGSEKYEGILKHIKKPYDIKKLIYDTKLANQKSNLALIKEEDE